MARRLSLAPQNRFGDCAARVFPGRLDRFVHIRTNGADRDCGNPYMRESADDCSRTKALLYNHPPKNPRLPIFTFVGRTVAAMVSRTSVGLVSASSSLSVVMSTGMAIKRTKADKERGRPTSLKSSRSVVTNKERPKEKYSRTPAEPLNSTRIQPEKLGTTLGQEST